MPATAGAAAWDVDSSIALSEQFDDNITLTTRPHNSVWGTTVTPRLGVQGRSEIWFLNLKGELRSSRYLGEDGLDKDDKLFNLAGEYDSSERTRWGFDGGYTQESLLDSELDASGLVFSGITRNRLSIAPSWIRALTERSNLRLGYQYVDITFQDAARTGLVNYETHDASAVFDYQWSERSLLTGAASFLAYRDTDAGTEVNHYILEAGVRYAFSETLTGTLSLGPRRVESSVPAGVLAIDPLTEQVRIVPFTRRETQNGYVVNASLERQLELGTWAVRAGRQLVPAGSGAVLQKDILSLRMSRRLTPSISADLATEVFETTAAGTSLSNVDRHYAALRMGLSWQPAERWILNAGYRYERQKFTTAADAADRNVLLFTVAYQWLPSALVP